MTTADHPSVEDARAAEVLAAHQRQSIGMTASSPDHCSCGEAVPPEPDLTTSGPAPTIEGRRYRAFAAHQAAALAARRAETTTDEVYEAGYKSGYHDGYPAGYGAARAETTTQTPPAEAGATADDAGEEVPSGRGEFSVLPRSLGGRAETTTATDEDALVEEAARAFYEGINGEYPTPWARLVKVDPHVAIEYRKRIRAALTAARLLATARTRPTRDEVVLALARANGWISLPPPGQDVEEVARFFADADAVLALLADQPETTTEWGTRNFMGKAFPASSEQAARHSIKDSGTAWTLVRREVTAWTEADR